jgi:hypothetical protein
MTVAAWAWAALVGFVVAVLGGRQPPPVHDHLWAEELAERAVVL